MSILLTILVENSGEFGGGSIAASNKPVKQFVERLPKDVKVRIIRYSDFAMWHMGPEPVSVAELEWINIPAGGFLSSLGHAINLAGQTLSSEKSDEQSVVLLISGGSLSDPEEIIAAVLKKYFSSENISRYALSLTSDADESVLKLFAGENVLPHTALFDPAEFLSRLGERDEGALKSSGKKFSEVSLSCTIAFENGDSVTVGVTGEDMREAKLLMREALSEVGENDAGVRESVEEYVRRVL